MTEPTTATDALTPALRGVLTLFEEVLHDVRFPDVDHRGLATLADDVAARRAELEEAEAAASRAREALDASVAVLVARAQRGLAYARIFAEGDAELASRVASLGAALAPSRPELRPVEAPKKRGRPRKVDTSLFPSDEAPCEAELDAAQ